MNIQYLIEQQRLFFKDQNTIPYAFRIEALRKLASVITASEKEISDALWKDLHKGEFESYVTEIGFVLGEIQVAIKHLKQWMKSKRKKTPLLLFGSKSKLVFEPYGLTLIMAPWNYPFHLQISPLIAAIAAGNCAILKPSTQAANVSKVLHKIINQTFDSRHIVLLADITHTQMDALLNEKFDFIFYTGGVNYGRRIMEAAAKHLTPIALELGGKNPCIVDSDANLKIAARRIVWGKFINAGQTCVAPDYVLVNKKIKDEFIEYLKSEILRQYGSDPKINDDYCRIINIAQTERLVGLLKDGKIIFGGQSDIEQKYISPTLLQEVNMSSELMKEEIFGPILPIFEFESLEEVLSLVNEREKSLALYYFTENASKAARMIRSTTSGGACINDVVVQIANPNLPFGGVGNSGMGNYHGIYGFLTFSHQRSLVYSSTKFNIGLKYAPYGKKLGLLRKFF